VKAVLIIVMLAWMFTGCAHREYYNIHKHPKHDIESDKARCTYLAESRVPLAQPLVHITINTKMSNKERKRIEAKRRQEQQQKEWDRDRRVRRLRDLCLKARGWRWRYKE